MAIALGTLFVDCVAAGFGAFWLDPAGLVRPWGFARNHFSQLSLEERCANSKWETPQARPLSGAWEF